jgi:hypothetical protein
MIDSVAKGSKFRPQNFLNSCQKLVLVYKSSRLLTSPTKLVDLAENLWFGNTGHGTLLPGKALHNVNNISNYKDEDDFKI